MNSYYTKKLNKRGFTLIELLAVIVILSIIMGIAIPNVVSTLEKSKKETYISDAKKFLTLAKTELSTHISKPAEGEIVKVKLSCVDNEDLTKDPDGNKYDEENSFVLVVRKDSKLVYYVNLVGETYNNKNRGVELVEKSSLDNDGRLRYVKKNVSVKTDDDIKNTTGVNGIIRVCNN